MSKPHLSSKSPPMKQKDGQDGKFPLLSMSTAELHNSDEFSAPTLPLPHGTFKIIGRTL